MKAIAEQPDEGTGNSEEDKPLPFKKGDIIYITDINYTKYSNNGNKSKMNIIAQIHIIGSTFYGYSKGKQGKVPSSCVQVYEEAEFLQFFRSNKEDILKFDNPARYDNLLEVNYLNLSVN